MTQTATDWRALESLGAGRIMTCGSTVGFQFFSTEDMLRYNAEQRERDKIANALALAAELAERADMLGLDP